MDKKRFGQKLAQWRAIEHENATRRAIDLGIIIPDEIEYVHHGEGVTVGDEPVPDLCRIKAVVSVKGFRCGACNADIPPGELYAFVKARTGGQWTETRLCGKCGMARVTLENSKK